MGRAPGAHSQKRPRTARPFLVAVPSESEPVPPGHEDEAEAVTVIEALAGDGAAERVEDGD
jgi:hypothetical protein